VSKVDLVLLGLLSEEPRHGYDIKQEIKRRNMENWVGVTTPAIYKGLARLEAKKDLSAHSETSSAHPDRTVYSITEQGRETIQRILHQSISELVHPFFPMLMGYGFAHLSDKPTLLASLATRLERVRGLRKEVEEIHEHFEEAECYPETAMDIVQYYADLVEMEIKWLKRILAKTEGTEPWPEGVFK